MISTKNIDREAIRVTGKILTFSNFISLTRFLIAFPIVYLHYHNEFRINGLVISLVVYGVLSDYLDGLVARKTNTVSELGKIIDPVSDKLCATVLFIYTVWIGWIPLWFLVISICRDVLIMLGSSFIKYKYGKVAMSNMLGKISVNVVALYWISIFFFRKALFLHSFLLYASTLIMLISFLDYFNRYRQIMVGAKFN